MKRAKSKERREKREEGKGKREEEMQICFYSDPLVSAFIRGNSS